MAVTGASGFIGLQLVKRLRQDGFEVTAITRSTAEQCISKAGEKWLHIKDPTDTRAWEDVIKNADYVVHLAGLAHQIDKRTDEDQKQLYRVNIDTTAALANAVASTRTVRRMLFLSSVAAMGDFSENPLKETMECSPNTEYGRSKLEAENCCKFLLSETVTDWCILRPPLVYGPGNPGNMGRLQRMLSARLPLPVGAFREKRSFVFVGNLVDLIVTSLKVPEASRELFLVSDGHDISTADLIRLIADVQGVRVPIISVPKTLLEWMAKLLDFSMRLSGRNQNVFQYSLDRLNNPVLVDASKARMLLGWSPPTSLEDGIRYTFGSK